MDQTKIIQDVQEGNVLKNFMSKYNDIKLDVVSLAEVEELVNNAITNSNQDELIAQITTLLDHVNDQMKYVSHDRR